ncbi:MAG TPA: phosphoribosylformylglycinamidine synthase [Pseudomonadales bacterium]|nr:phosphoribosylformylglycinamidine synthase [Pseudomonadales bacterium]
MTDTLLVLPGPPAFSQFRLNKLLTQARASAPAVAELYAEYVHLLAIDGELTNRERGVAQALLEYGPRVGLPQRAGEPRFTVLPRAGTISPWSSKATDIFRICGLAKVRRVERAVRWYVAGDAAVGEVAPLLHDRMTQSIVVGDDFSALFAARAPQPFGTIAFTANGRAALVAANDGLGLALSGVEIDYLSDAYRQLGRDPTDVELMMFAQANSEHCRHKIFNARWTDDGKPAPHSLFDMIRNTHRHINGAGILSAYSDNAAVIEGYHTDHWMVDPESQRYLYVAEPVHVLMKVETHNHPTAIAPYPGAATGSGGEIRDEGAVGRGSKPKAGLVGFTTSHLNIPGYEQPWEIDTGKPDRIVSALDIMLEGPIGAAAFNNEFGRPALTGYFRTFEYAPANDLSQVRGYHKPVMIAGGIGNVRPEHVNAIPFDGATHLIVIGGPAMLIGLGGGAASSMAAGQSSSDLDFASVQRDNAEMQRRCQEVIDGCAALGDANPIRLIHDVGAGGLSNALPELVKDAGRGGRFEMRRVPSADPGLAPLELWCNEAQERYVLAVANDDLATFERICARERCPFAIVGSATLEPKLIVADERFHNAPVDLPMAVLFGNVPKLQRAFSRRSNEVAALDLPRASLADSLDRVLRFPSVGSKQFLVTIGDRSITGFVVRDQMVGPWQVPVADAAVTTLGFKTFQGEAMAMGERSPLALIDPAASARIAIGEALTNLASVAVEDLSRVVLSANWMAAAGRGNEDQALFDAVTAVGMELCPALGIAIPVGKDSLSMHTQWHDERGERAVTAPMTLIVSAFAPVPDVRRVATPELRFDRGRTRLLLVDLGGANRLGGSALAQTHRQLGDRCPDVDDAARLAGFFRTVQALLRDGRVLAYHDRSDGGLAVCALEMAFAGRCGLDIDLEALGVTGEADAVAAVFAEELGAVLQVAEADVADVRRRFAGAGLAQYVHDIGAPQRERRIIIRTGNTRLLDADAAALQSRWAETSYRMQRMRDDPACADEEFARIASDDPGMRASLTFALADDVAAPYINRGVRPRVAVLREQGVNSHLEMAAVFDRAGFDPVDVHMSDLLEERRSLRDFNVLVACGGFSYGDVLGGGGGWAKSILYHERVRDAFAAFFEADTLSLGVCNGCQMFAHLKSIIPGAAHWPRFVRNRSEQFEARASLVRINAVDSPWIDGMAGSVLPIAVAHGEGRAEFVEADALAALTRQNAIALQFVYNRHNVADSYPANPNGAVNGIAGIVNVSGRVLAVMPHPERVFRSVNNSWHPDGWGEDGPWVRLFRNARVALG